MKGRYRDRKNEFRKERKGGKITNIPSITRSLNIKPLAPPNLFHLLSAFTLRFPILDPDLFEEAVCGVERRARVPFVRTFLAAEALQLGGRDVLRSPVGVILRLRDILLAQMGGDGASHFAAGHVDRDGVRILACRVSVSPLPAYQLPVLTDLPTNFIPSRSGAPPLLSFPFDPLSSFPVFCFLGIGFSSSSLFLKN